MTKRMVVKSLRIWNFSSFLFLMLILFHLFFTSGRAMSAQSFSFTNTGQRLGQIIDGIASIACGDMNNDGYVDLVLASQEKGTIIQVYLNDGKGNFTRTNDTFPVTKNQNLLWNFGIVLRDFNQDGLLDIATADAWRGVNVYLNTKNQGFIWSQAILVPEVNEVKGIDAADIDGDADADIVFGGHNGVPDRGDRIYLNNGFGHFNDSGQRIGSDLTWDTIFGDVDNDGDFDYVSINRYGKDASKIHINNGEGEFDRFIDIPTMQTDDSFDVKLSDLNMDGLLDIVIANSLNTENGTTSKIFMNNGNLDFELTNDMLGEPNCETKGIEVIDVTNDGYYDIVLGNYCIANMIYENDGAGRFEKMDVEIPTNHTTAIAATDVNNDGYIDLIIGNAADGYYRVYLNDGEGLQKNLSPDPPTILRSEVNGKNVCLSWDSGSDRETQRLGLTYNIRIGTQPGLNDIVSGTSSYGLGNLGNALSYKIRGLKKNTYYWSVQTVDSSFAKSEWSHEEQFIISSTPTPYITVNGSDGPITLNQLDTLTVTVSLNNNDITDNADWWLAASMPFGLFFYTFEGWTENWQPVYQGPLFHLGSFEVLHLLVSGLPSGTYTFYFGIDTDTDGNVTWNSIYYDTAEINITE